MEEKSKNRKRKEFSSFQFISHITTPWFIIIDSLRFRPRNCGLWQYEQAYFYAKFLLLSTILDLGANVTQDAHEIGHR